MTVHRALFAAASALTVLAADVDPRCADGSCIEEDDETMLLSLRASVKHVEGRIERNELATMCPGSKVGCAGNQCCPGVAASGMLTFPCPTSSRDFNGCAGDRSVLAKVLASTSQDRDVPAVSAPHVKCPGGEGTCAGNQCCAGNAVTGGKNFPCPNSDKDFNGCQGDHDMTVKALLAALTREQKYKFLRGVGWVNGSWDLDPHYYIGDAGLKNEYGIPTLNMQDNGQGFRTVSEAIIPQVTSWPVTLAVASSWSEENTYKWAKAMGQEFKKKGSNVILGPGLNVHRVALGGRNGEYASGESPYFGARIAKPYVEGVQSEAVLAVAKHYVLNNQETHRDTVDAQADARTMWEIYYPPFEAASKAGAASFMCAYNLVNGIHACGNPDTLNTDLKQDMGFAGWVQSDWWALHNFAANEGVDQEMPGDSTLSAQAWYTDANLNTLSDAKVDDMVSRMITPMMKNGLFEPRNHVCMPPNCDKELYEVVATTDENQALCKELAAGALILLKNEGNVLPLTSATKTIALIGPACNAAQDVQAQLTHWDLGSYYNIGGSGRVIADDPETIQDGFLAACKSRGCDVIGYEGTDVQEAVKIAKSADFTFICGGTSSTEGHDRASLSVDDQDFLVDVAKRLRSANRKVVALTMTPAAIVMPWIDDVDGAMNIFLAGKYTGSAFADGIFGVRNPSAKLLVTMPKSESQTIPPCQGVPCPYTEKLKVGYLALQDEEVTFPFGHGLSYTTFDYSALQIQSHDDCPSGIVCVRATVKNSGSVAGVEIAQLYLSYPSSAGEPAKQLRGFVRTEELAPGAQTVVQFDLTHRDFSIYNADTRAWEIPKGTFQVFVGRSSRDLPLRNMNFVK